MKAIVHGNDDEAQLEDHSADRPVSIGARWAQPMGHFSEQPCIRVGDRLSFNAGGFRGSIRVSIQRPITVDPDSL